MKKPQSLTTLGKSMLGLIAFTTTVGGAIWYVGKPPFANEQYVQQQFQQTDRRYNSMRLNQVEDSISRLEREKRERRRLSDFDEGLLRSLYHEREMLRCELKIGKCG